MGRKQIYLRVLEDFRKKVTSELCFPRCTRTGALEAEGNGYAKSVRSQALHATGTARSPVRLESTMTT